MSKGKVLVTGATGFFGQHLCRELVSQKYEVIGTFNYNTPKYDIDVEYTCTDLLNAEYVNGDIRHSCPDYIIHAAGYNGGIKFNMENGYDIFYKNTLMGLNIIEAARQAKVKKMLSIVASCAYPEETSNINDVCNGLLYNEDFFEGAPHPSVACHGYAKRNLQLLSKFANQQYGLNAVTACVTTMYGPGDSLDLNRTKVMMALIKKFCDAKKDKAEEVIVWGTGKASRQFIYVKDAAKCVINALENYNNSDVPVNISPLGDIEIRKLVREIAWAVGYEGKVVFDYTKPDGQMKKELVPDQMFKDFKFTTLQDGIKETVKWYQSLA